MRTMVSLHFITRPDRSAPADVRTEDLGDLDALVVDHFRNALNALDTPSDAGVARASVRLFYAVETASMVHGVMHPSTMALRDFREVVDAVDADDVDRWFVIDLALTACLAALRAASPVRRRALQSLAL